MKGEIIDVKGVKYLQIDANTIAEIASFTADGTPVLKTIVTTKEDGIDKEGNPIRSVAVKVMCLKVQGKAVNPS
jgi:hypothetical protein